MTKLKINRIFAYIFILLSLIKVVYSLIFNHSHDVVENIFHYIENGVHIILLVFLCKQAVKNKIGHFFHEYFLEAIIMGTISTIALIYTPFALRMLGQSQYGLFGTASSFTNYLSLLSLGIGGAYIRWNAKYRAENDVEGERRLNGMYFTMFSIACQ